MDKLVQQLEQTNQQLKLANTGVVILKRGNRLSLRGMLPDKNGNGFSQQIISLGIYANATGIKQAKLEAQKLSSAIALKEFNWDNYLNRDRVVGSIESWIETKNLPYRLFGNTHCAFALKNCF